MNTARDTKGHWTKGTCGNPGGRPRIVEDVRELAMAETPACIRALVKIRDDTKAPAQARVAAANAILDRALGKPIQAVIATTTERFVFELPTIELSEDEWLRDNSKLIQ